MNFTLQPCNRSSLLAFRPTQMKICEFVSNTNTSPSFISVQEIVGSWRIVGCRLPLTMNNFGVFVFSTWDNPVETPPCSSLELMTQIFELIQ